jgi:hypothetical protein
MHSCGVRGRFGRGQSGMLTVVSGIVALVAAALGARPVGRALKTRPFAWFIGSCAAIVLVAVALMAVAIVLAAPDRATSDLLQGVGLGIGFGGLSGLRYGYKGLFEVAATKDRS